MPTGHAKRRIVLSFPAFIGQFIRIGGELQPEFLNAELDAAPRSRQLKLACQHRDKRNPKSSV
jgi:hypothetical protein